MAMADDIGGGGEVCSDLADISAELPSHAAGAPSQAPAFTVEAEPWRWWREQMPITRRWAYFDHAAVSPLPRGAAQAIRDFAQEASDESDTLWPKWAGEVEALRDEMAEFLNVGNDEIALIPNTSYGINLIAEGIRWQPGDNVVVPYGEFPANLFPWLNQRRHGVEVRIIGNRDDIVDERALIDAIDSRTRLVAASWVGYSSGYRIDLDRVVDETHRRGALFFLDAIQGLGVFPLDLGETHVDFLAADGHKWLLGPEGAGVAMIRREHLKNLTCVPVGWNSVRSAMKFSHAEFELRPAASRYEIGSQNMVGMRALRKSFEIFRRVAGAHGREAIGERVLQLAGTLHDLLSAMGARTSVAQNRSSRSGIVTFAFDGIAAERIRSAALAQQVVVSCRGIGVRASVHAYNDEADIHRLVAAAGSAL